MQTGQWSTLASQSPIDGHSAVMYRPGKILKSGTWADPDFPSDVPVTNRAAALDLNETVPTWREVAPMKWKRTFHTLTVLPDGDVLAMGGTRSPQRQRRHQHRRARARDLEPGDRHVEADGDRASGPAATTTPRCCCPTGASCWPAAAASTAR